MEVLTLFLLTNKKMKTNLIKFLLFLIVHVLFYAAHRYSITHSSFLVFVSFSLHAIFIISFPYERFFKGFYSANVGYDKMKDLHNKIVDWGYEKCIIQACNPIKQWEKTQEEVNELKESIEKNDKHEIKDAIGDIAVTIMLQAEMQGFTFEECLEQAYNTISKRTGKIVDGKFVKD